MIIDKLPKTITLNIIGHTDDTPRPSGKWSSNWELGSARAISVAKELIKDKVNPKILTVCSKGEYDPIASNLTEKGKEKNRRVELYFFSNQSDKKPDAQKSILDKGVKKGG